MLPRIVECVLIFSDGRDAARIKIITDAIVGVGGVTLSDVVARADTNCTAVIFRGDPDQVLEAASRAVKAAKQLVDAVAQPGALPRSSAFDLCPFVPVAGVTLDDCTELARRLGKRVREELDSPLVGTLMSMTAAEFVEEVSRETPTPAGGSVAALSGALGAALASMVANLTRGRAAGQEDEIAVLKAAEIAQRAKDVLVRCVDEDANAFNAYLQARRLPRGTHDERIAREAAMQQSLKLAVDVPWRIAVTCVEVMKAASLAMRHGNPAAITDAMQGVVMGFAGARGGLWSVTANLKAVTDAAFAQDMKGRCAGVLAEAQDLMDEASRYGALELAPKPVDPK